MNRMSTAETAYLAGVFDGEGWFITNKRTNPALCIAMTDFDIITRLHETSGVGRLNEKTFANKKDQLQWTVSVQEELEQLIYAILPFLSERRTQRAREVLADIEERRSRAEWRTLHYVCGHDKTEENTYHTNQGKTVCRTCSLGRASRRSQRSHNV